MMISAPKMTRVIIAYDDAIKIKNAIEWCYANVQGEWLIEHLPFRIEFEDTLDALAFKLIFPK